MKRLLILLAMLLWGCTSSPNNTVAVETIRHFQPQVWVEKNPRTGWNDLMINTIEAKSVRILTSKLGIEKATRSPNGDLVAYVSYEKKNRPAIFIQNIMMAKREIIATEVEETTVFRFDSLSNNVIIKTGTLLKTVPVTNSYN